MKRAVQLWLAVAVFSVGVGGWATRTQADDKTGPAGTWKGSLTRPDGQTTEFTLKLKQEGTKWTGVYLGGPNNQETVLPDVQYKDGELAFQLTVERNGNKITLKYKGKVSGDGIKGKVDVTFNDQDFNLDWEAKREKT